MIIDHIYVYTTSALTWWNQWSTTSTIPIANILLVSGIFAFKYTYKTLLTQDCVLNTKLHGVTIN